MTDSDPCTPSPIPVLHPAAAARIAAVNLAILRYPLRCRGRMARRARLRKELALDFGLPQATRLLPGADRGRAATRLGCTSGLKQPGDAAAGNRIRRTHATSRAPLPSRVCHA